VGGLADHRPDAIPRRTLSTLRLFGVRPVVTATVQFARERGLHNFRVVPGRGVLSTSKASIDYAPYAARNGEWDHPDVATRNPQTIAHVGPGRESAPT